MAVVSAWYACCQGMRSCSSQEAGAVRGSVLGQVRVEFLFGVGEVREVLRWGPAPSAARCRKRSRVAVSIRMVLTVMPCRVGR